LSEALKNTDIYPKNSDNSINALSRKAFNDEILKLYKPESKKQVMQWLNDTVHPDFEEKAQKTLSLVASIAQEDTLKLPNNKINATQIIEILKNSIPKAINQLIENHNKHVLYNLDADDIRRGEKAFRELINVDVPEVILNKVGKEIDKMARENPQRFVNFSESCTVRYPQGKEVISCELNSVSDALKFVEEHPHNHAHINKHSSPVVETNRNPVR
jgi:hypothetical protein